ncbi:MAG: hypothetical protein KDE51_01655 [Anaerolineales bacterium]|nr:hypothetical protein [Anaerolineales bacterium]
MPKEKQVLPCDSDDPVAQKLLVSGLVQLETELVEIRRGNVVMTQDGVEAGVVAAVVLDCPQQEITHFLLGFVPPTAVYHQVPLRLINRIEQEMVWLNITKEACDNLPRYQSIC